MKFREEKFQFGTLVVIVDNQFVILSAANDDIIEVALQSEQRREIVSFFYFYLKNVWLVNLDSLVLKQETICIHIIHSA